MTIPIPTYTALEEKFAVCGEFSEEFHKFHVNYPHVLRSICKKNGIPSPWLGPEHPAISATLIALAFMKKAESVLEIGYQAGGSAIPFQNYVDYFGGQYQGFDSCEDINASVEHAEAIRKCCVKMGVDCGVIWTEAFDVSKVRGSVDFVFIDHWKELYLQSTKDLVESAHLAPEAWLVYHDIDVEPRWVENWKEVKKYVLDNDLGQCHELRDGFQGLYAYDLGLVTLKGQ